jgi:serine/threonine protein kinase
MFLDDLSINKLLIQILVALKDIHNTGNVHGDIKPANLMFVTHAEKTVLQFIDFGVISSILEAGQTMQNIDS